jgi:sulfate permease, SulP family
MTARADLIAGLSIAGLLLPEAVAYSSIAGLPPQAGVTALFAGLLCYGLVGTSRFAVVSATSSSAAVLLAATHAIAGGDELLRLALADGLVVLTGLFFVVGGFAGLGAISNFVAKPVLRGFAFGLAVTIAIRQMPKVVGVSPANGDIFHFIAGLFSRAHSWNLAGLALALVALALLKLFARWRGVPAAFLVIAAGIGLDLGGVTAAHHIRVVGPIDVAIHWPSLPDLPRTDWLRLGELAFAMVLILYAESYGSIRTFALRHGDRISPDRDLFGLGIANIASGLFQGLPVGAGYSATSANEAAGAQTRGAARMAAAILLALVLTVLPWIERTPEPVLAAIVIHAVGHSIDLQAFRRYFAWRRDRIVVVCAAAAVLVLGVLDGLLAAIGVSLLVMLRELSEPRVAWLGRLREGHDYIYISRHPEAKPIPGVLIARPDSPMFFANAERVLAAIGTQVRSMPGLHAVIVSLEETPDLDSTSIEALSDFAQAMDGKGIVFLLARVKDHVRDVLQRAALGELPERRVAGWSVDDAVTAALAHGSANSA